MSQNRLVELLENPRIWKFGNKFLAVVPTVPSGFSELDKALSGGWPLGSVTEILCDECGAGELSLLMPALATLSRQSDVTTGDWLLWVAPPYMPYAPALVQSGIELSRVLVVRARESAHVLWAMEQALVSATCVAVLGWCSAIDGRAMRRLQLAAERAACLVVVFRPTRFMRQPSAAALRMHLQPDSDGMQLAIIKSRFGRPGTICLKV
jgi:hypothetical protein